MASTDECRSCYHQYDNEVEKDANWDEGERQIYYCLRQPCPNRLVLVVRPDNYESPGPEYVDPEEGQLAYPFSPASEASVAAQLNPESEHSSPPLSPVLQAAPKPYPSFILIELNNPY